MNTVYRAEAVRNSIQSAYLVAVELPTEVGVIIWATNQAYMDGMVSAMEIGAIIMLLASTMAFLILPKKFNQRISRRLQWDHLQQII